FLGLEDFFEEALSDALSRTGSHRPASPGFSTDSDDPGSRPSQSSETENLRMGSNTPAGGQPGPEEPGQVPLPPIGTSRPKVKTPDTFSGEREQWRKWRAQIQLYFRAVGWQNGYDEAKIDYACSLLRENAGVWIIPYVEQPDEAPWHTWEDFMTELQRQFGPVDPVGEARVKLKELYQGTSSMTAYWNDFRLIATEANLDQTTAGEWLLAGMKTKLQEAWGNESTPFTTTERLANWAIEKETKLAMVKHVQSSRKNETPRKNDGTFKPRTTTQGGDAMDLD